VIKKKDRTRLSHDHGHKSRKESDDAFDCRNGPGFCQHCAVFCKEAIHTVQKEEYQDSATSGEAVKPVKVDTIGPRNCTVIWVLGSG